ncbi:hypothetical protein SKAU_G00157610 [Synaphobranchus kaupii]|uniref:Uncharacterized protein n=1 Tax=Synaphobranchus kaupii TaxID=118154 RepID=A0A9Q1IYJ8_SYNKA|nr:hypothetical protein SKAU_G00157610 [Synaphobranchus kaupii]
MTTGGGPQSTQDLTTAEEVASSTLTPLSVDGFGGLEVGLSGNPHHAGAEVETTSPSWTSRGTGSQCWSVN